jgi:hypothetical protein
MQLALVWYTILNLVILGCVLLFVRASRARAHPDERQDLEENALVRADWELVRTERCLPSGCPRVIGQSPRPRKDVTCEVCATTFLEVRLQRLLGAPLPTEPGWEPPRVYQIVPGCAGTSGAASREERRSPEAPAAERDTARRDQLQADAETMHWAMLRLGLGVVCVATGAAVAAFSGLLWLVIPGYVAVLIGLGLMASSAASGTV